MNETQDRTGIGTVIIVLFVLLFLLGAVLFGAGILGFGAEGDATATPSLEPTPGSSPSAALTETPGPTSAATVGAASATPATAQTPLALQAHAAAELSAQSQTGEALGQIDDIVVSLILGDVSYAVLQRTDGRYGLVPLPAFDIFDPQAGLFLTSLEPEIFDGGPVYEPEQNPDLITDPAWDSEVRSYWSGHIVLPEGLSSQRDTDQVIAASLTGLAELQVLAGEGTVVGEFVSFILDLETHRPVYLLIELNAQAIEGDGTILVPWERIAKVTADPDAMILAASVEALAGAPRVNLAEFPDWLVQPDWDRSTREYWSSLN